MMTILVWNRILKWNLCVVILGLSATAAVAQDSDSGVKWFRGEQLHLHAWYSRDSDGNPQCYSLNGRDCSYFKDASKTDVYVIRDNATLRSLENNAGRLKQYIDAHDEVRLVFTDGNWTGNIALPSQSIRGKTVTLEVKTIAWGVNLRHEYDSLHIGTGGVRSMTYLNGRWVNLLESLNDQPDPVTAAKPLTCGSHHQRVWGSTGYHTPIHWCRKALSPRQSLHKNNVQEIITSKTEHMDRSFTQMEDWKLLKIDVDNNYQARLDDLAGRVRSKGNDKAIACAFAWTIPGAIACGIITSEYNDLVNAYNALVAERDNKLREVRALVAEGRTMQWHELHQQWAQNDDTHFAGLLKEESLALDELKQLKAGYEQTAEEKHQEYLAAVQQYMDDTNPGNIVRDVAEDLPLLGPEVRHIVDYVENPTDRNLRRMLLGLAGPVGETVEGVIELTTGDSSLSDGKLRFLSDMLTKLGQDDSIGEALEDIVSDAINDLGDEAIESIRQAGLWVDKPSDDPPLEVDYASVVDLRTQTVRYAYYPWDSSLDGNENVRQFRAHFTPENDNYLDKMSDPLDYDSGSLTDMEYASGGSAFDHHISAIFAHSMGKDYAEVVKRNPKYRDWSETQVNFELYKVVADIAYYEPLLPRWVDSSVIGQRPAGLIYDNDHAVIVLNSDLLNPADDLSKFYFEELGHALNWWRCKIFDVDVSYCEVHGDAGARFRDAVLVNPSLHDGPYEALLSQLPAHTEVDRVLVKFSNGKFGVLEGWPNYYTMNDHIAADGKFSWLMRLGLDVASEYPFVSDEFDMEVVINAPKSRMKGNPWRKSDNGYCKTDDQTDCNMPTIWVSISFRDAIKVSMAKLPRVKDSKFANLGFDVSPRLVRKHGGKLPFQLTSVNGTDWEHKSYHNIYSKKFTAGLEAKLDLWKMGHAIKGAKPSSVHKPEFSLKSTPASGSYLVQIATRDTEDFAGWLVADIVSMVAGCAGGFAIGIVAEQDPVLFCHAFSDLTEGVESAFQGLDESPTMFFEADGNVTLPVSLEYKYATSGNKIKGTPTTSGGSRTFYTEGNRAGGRLRQRRIWHTDGSLNPWHDQRMVPTQEGEDVLPDESISNTQVKSFKTKAGAAFKKLGARSISPVAVFRFRVGFDYAEKVIQEGAHNLPSVIVED